MELGKQSDPRKGYHFLKAMPRVLPPVCAKFGYLFYFSGWKIVVFLHCLQLGGYENVDGRNWLSVIYQCHLRCLWFFRWTNWSLEESCSERSDFPTYVFQDYIFQRITYTLFHLCLSILLQKTIYFIAPEEQNTEYCIYSGTTKNYLLIYDIAVAHFAGLLLSPSFFLTVASIRNCSDIVILWLVTALHEG